MPLKHPSLIISFAMAVSSFFKSANTVGQYFFNGFSTTPFPCVHGLTSAAPLGVVQGQQAEGGLSQVLPLTGATYATARFSFGDNYFIPAAALKSSGISSSVDLVETHFLN